MSSGNRKGRTNHQHAAAKQSNGVSDFRKISDNKYRSRASPYTRNRHDFNSTKQGRNRCEERHSGERRNITHHKSGTSSQICSTVEHQSSNGRSKNGETFTRGKPSTTRKELDKPETSAGTSSRSKQTKFPPRNAGNERSNVRRNESRREKKSNGSSNRNLHKSRQTPSKDTKDVRRKSPLKQNESSRKRGRSRSKEKHQTRNSGKNSRKRSSTSMSTQPPKKKPRKEMNPFIRYDDRLTILLSKDPSDIIMALLNDHEAFFEFLNYDKINAKQVEEILEILSNLYETPYTQNFAKIFAGFQSTAFLKHVRHYIFQLKQENRPKPKTHLERIIQFFHELLNRFPTLCEELPLELLSAYSAQWETNIKDNNNNNNTTNDEKENNMEENEGTDHNLTHPNTNISPSDEDPGKQIKDSILKLISLRDEKLRQKLSPSNEIAVATPPDDYKSIPVFPRREDIFPDQPPFLRRNIVRSRYSDVTHYLDVQFRLLREDYIAPIRDGVLEAVNIQENRARSIHVYRNVRVAGRILDTKFGGLLHRISFDVSRMGRVNWTHSKRFKYGSLYCLIDSETVVNKAESTMYFITITERKVEDLKNGFLNVKFLDDKLVDSIPFGKQFFMIESPAYFESYRHVLEGLQNFSKDNLPFQRYLVECNSEARPPVYLSKRKNGNLLSNETNDLDDLINSLKAEINNGVSKRSDICYDLSKALSCRNARSVSVLDPCSWPSQRHVDLNSSQFNALKAALTQEFVVIQGPPGTGKTFVGLRIASALLENKSIWRRRNPQKEEGRLGEDKNTRDPGKHSPILVVCYTNHALDQFLEGILQITGNVVRVGGRGKSESLKHLNLKQRKRITKESACYHDLKTELKDIQFEIEEVKTVLEDANKKLNPSNLEEILNDEEKEQLKQWERVASQMRVHRIEAWLRMQDERDEDIERRMKRRRSSTPSSECNETENNPDCSNLVSTSDVGNVAAKRLRKTVDSAINEECVEQPTQTLNSKVEEQVIKKSSTFQKAQCTPVENGEKELCGSQQLEEGEIPDSDDEMTYECNDIHAMTNEDVTIMDVHNNNLISRTVDHLKKNPLEENGTFGYTIKIQAQEIPLNLSQDPTRMKTIKSDVRSENTAKNALEKRVNQLSTTWVPRSFSQEEVAISSVDSMRDVDNSSTMSTAAGSGERSNNKLEIANNKDIVTGKHSNNIRDTEMDSTSTKSFNARNSAKVNDEKDFHIVNNAGNENNSIFDDKNLNERDKEDDAINSKMSLSEKNVEEGEIFDAEDTDSDETSEGDDEGRVHGIDLTTIFESKFLLEGGKSTGKCANEENTTNTECNFEKGSTKRTPEAEQQMLFEHEAQNPGEKENEEKKYQVEFKELSEEQRSDLYQKWCARFFEYHKKKIDSLRERHDKELQQLSEIEGIQNEKILRNVDVIGMTTTGAAKHRLTLQEIKPRIVIVEEAAEVLEGHVITALSSGTDHLILIGDHKQLKPNPAVYELARKYNLDVSLFERMVSNGLKCHSLSTQHRMRPEIADIMRIIYPKLVDDASVKCYRSITGVQENVYFIDHDHPESGNEELKSHSNQHEVDFVAALCKYLLLQGYQGNRITVLTMYTGQLLMLQRCMPQESFDSIRISSVDNFQGEESDIIILSLVRSNKTGNIGFLNVPNRVCVALSRAKQAMYCIGNISMMATKNRLWKSIKNHLQQKSLIGKSLPLSCPNHPQKKIEASSAEDFKKAPEGGCMSPCEFRLPCGHVCSLYCHSIDQKHEKYYCTEKCLEELCDLKHCCERQCHYNKGKCGKCKVKIPYVVPSCKHAIEIECWERDKIKCPIPCTKVLDRCGHRCAGKCGEDCNSVACREKVTRTLKCGHEVSMPCSTDVEFYKCREPCEKLLDCKHKCPGDCSSCKKGKFHVRCKQPCKRILICSHECEEPCTGNCPPCRKRCRNRCNHSVCRNQCGYPCVPCRMPCMWKCEHYKCNKRCGETCDREKCNEPCRKPLKCGHQCAGICGDFCPQLCRICDKDELQTIFLGNEDEPDALYVELVDCGHVFEVSDLDYWMEGMKDESVAIQLKVCPRCKTPIRRSLRYGNIVKKTLADIEKVKKIKLDELKRLREKRFELKERVDKLSIKYEKFVDYRLKMRVQKLYLNPDDYTTIENQINFLNCLGEIDDKFFDGSENAMFVQRSSKLVSELNRIHELVRDKTLLTTQELKDISENISFLSLNCQFQLILWKIEENDGCNLSEEIKSRIESAKGIMSRQDNASSTTLAVTDEDRAMVASVIDQVNRKLGIASLTPKEHAGILKAFNLSKGHWSNVPMVMSTL